MTARGSRWLWFALAAAASGCGLSINGELPDIEVVQPGVMFPGVPANGGTELAVTIPVAEQVHDRLGLAPDAYSEVRAHEVRVTLRSGPEDLSFLRSLRVTIAGVDELQPNATPVEIATYQSTGPAGAELVMPRVPPADVTSAWRADQVIITVEAIGTMPAQAWSVDVSGRFSAKLKY